MEAFNDNGAAAGAYSYHADYIGTVTRQISRSPDDTDDDGCDEEWEEARNYCVGELAKSGGGSSGLTGGYTTIEECARGLLSERCGGNYYER